MAAAAPLAKVVSAYANLSVKGERKQIQHLEGGIVGSLHVTEDSTLREVNFFWP